MLRGYDALGPSASLVGFQLGVLATRVALLPGNSKCFEHENLGGPVVLK